MKRRSRLSDECRRKAVGLVVDGASALRLQRELPLGSYHTALRLANQVREEMAKVDWPSMRGSVVLSDESLRVVAGPNFRIWLGAELRGNAFGLIAMVPATMSAVNDAKAMRQRRESSARVITPKGGYLNWLAETGYQRLPRDEDTPELKQLSRLATEFRLFLSQRRHRILKRSTVGSYLTEFVFHHNARVLSWTEEEKISSVWETLRGR
ncbi:MAG: hypothetical protein SFV32_07115 [Opitutaceae bacterium]|nr:hypothetical protein [Opitutaceae bacterium]